MARKKDDSLSLKIVNISPVLLILFISIAFIFEMELMNIEVNYSFVILLILISLFITISFINSMNYYRVEFAFNIPLILQIFYTLLMLLCKWQSSFYLLICLVLCVVSCLYSNFIRTVVFIIAQNIFIGYLILSGVPVAGYGNPIHVSIISWIICIFINLIMLKVTRNATVSLTKALEQQNSFNDLLDSTENFVAMINERNEVIYASRTLSKLAKIEEPELVQGRPIIDLFPGKSLKVYAGKLLSEKRNYMGDWEFSLDGQKHYFKAVSHSLPGDSGSTLIDIYDMTHLAERDEIAIMKDSMKIGLFFMDGNFIIQDHYSRFLEEMLSRTDLFGKVFTDLISDSVTPSELEAIKDYFTMVIKHTYDQEMLEEINPLNELRYVNAETGERKVFQFTFTTVERGRGEVFILVTVYDITVSFELKQQLAEEEAKRQEEMQSVFELINIEQSVFNDFSDDMEYEFGQIDKSLKDNTLSAHEVLVKVYQSIHAIKSNAVILGLNTFGNKLHALESKIKVLREEESVSFSEMLNLTMDVEGISREKENYYDIINKLRLYGSGGNAGGVNQNIKVFIESLAQAADRISTALDKQTKFISDDIDEEAILLGPRRIMKEILMQLIRNAVVHGIEEPDVRREKGKNETGVIRCSIKLTDDKTQIDMKLTDDGSGLDYKRIAEKALQSGLINEADRENKNALIKVIFKPGFSTAEIEGIYAGRGIGLNLVRDRINEVKGAIKIRSETDKGTIFSISIPVVKN